MLSNFSIERFRGFRELRIPRLSRVNLFVGTNNAGKTSILEAAEILARGLPEALWRSPRRRNERTYESAPRESEEARSSRTDVDFSHLFFGHTLEVGSSFLLHSGGTPELKVLCELLEAPFEPGEGLAGLYAASQRRLFPPSAGERVLTLSYVSHLVNQSLPLHYWSHRPGALLSSIDQSPSVRFVGTETPESRQLSFLWDRVVLSPEEVLVTDALRIIEPHIERVAFLTESRSATPTIFLKLEGSEQRLPLGSVGDGLKRLLTLALHLVSAQKGYLLVDEIDTGLHYTVMADMWRLVIETARRLDVQVLSTTHSLDCVRALAWVHEQQPDLATDVTLHRVESGNPETVSYTSEELVTAARHHIEVR